MTQCRFHTWVRVVQVAWFPGGVEETIESGLTSLPRQAKLPWSTRAIRTTISIDFWTAIETP